MARNVSPFASLTSEEKQIKWMEYQTIRLPYTQVASSDWKEPQTVERSTEPAQQVDFVCPEPSERASAGNQANPMAVDAHHSQHPSAQQSRINQQSERLIPPPEVFVGSHSGTHTPAAYTSNQQSHSPTPSAYQLLNQKTRHRQYDAVIERMKQAAQKTGSYCNWSK